MFTDLCNECGNCDTFCLETGAQRVKPRFDGSRESFEAAGSADGILLEQGGRVLLARLAGVRYSVTWEEEVTRFSDGRFEVTLDGEHRVTAIHVIGSAEGHRLSLWPDHALRLPREVSPLSTSPSTGE